MKRQLFGSCLWLQLRLVRKRLVALAAMALVALLLSGAAALGGQALLARRDFTGVAMAVAAEEDDPRVDAMVGMLADLQDVSAFATIHQVSAAEAEAMVRRGDAAVAVVLPAGFLDSVLTGENLAPTLLVDASRPLEMMLVTQLAQSATRILARAQQGITYTLAVYDAAQPDEPARSRVVQDINLRYAGWVLGRSSMFRPVVVGATGALSVLQFYLLSAVLFFAVLSLPVLYRLYALPAAGGWPARLRAGGCPLWMWAASGILAGAAAILLMLCLLVLGIGLAGGGAGLSPALLPGLALCALFLSCFGFLCCNAGNILAAVSLNFLLAAAGVIVCGGLVPTVLLPAAVAALAPASPMGWMHAALAPLYGAAASPGALALLAGGTAALFGVALLYCRRRERRAAP